MYNTISPSSQQEMAMGDAEEVFRREQAAAELRQNQEKEREDRKKREIADRILATAQQVVEKLRQHNYADNKEYGLTRSAMEVDGVERPVWWVTTYEWKQSRNPMERFYITGDGTIVGHYGSSIPLAPGVVIYLHSDILETIQRGLQRIIDTTPQAAPATTSPDHGSGTGAQSTSWWRRLMG